jgi:hypothetical protein
VLLVCDDEQTSSLYLRKAQLLQCALVWLTELALQGMEQGVQLYSTTPGQAEPNEITSLHEFKSRRHTAPTLKVLCLVGSRVFGQEKPNSPHSARVRKLIMTLAPIFLSSV